MLASMRRIDASLIEEQGHLSRISARRDIYHRQDSIPYGASSYNINKQWRLIEHIDVIVRTADSKKSMPDPTVMRSNSFKDV
jgi:hypothetical protein